MAQTDDGFLWLATSSGLVRFDGVQFERYTPAPGETVPSASIRSLLAVPGNALWIGWLFGGASLLHDGHMTTFGEAEGYPPGTTYQFLRDRSDFIWVATSSGLARFDGRRWQRIGAQWNVTGQRAVSLFQSRDETLAVFTDRTLMLLPKGASSFRGTGGTSITRVPIVQAPDGGLYLTDVRGIRSIKSLAEYERADRQLVASESPMRGDGQLTVDRDGGLWFETTDGLGRIANPRASQVLVEHFSKPEGLSDTNVHRIFEDRQGSIWVLTSGGIDQFRQVSFVPPVGVLQGEFPSLLADPDGGLLFAGLDSALRHLAPDGTLSSIDRLFVTCAYRDRNGVEWYGSQPRVPIAELVRREGTKIRRITLPTDIPPEVDIQAMTTDTSGALWISVIRKGIYRLVNNAWIQPPELLDHGKLPAIVMMTDSTGHVWLGYPANRVLRWAKGGARVFSASEGLDVGNILALHEKGRQLWVGGEHGLAVLEATRFRPMTSTDQTVLHGITGIVETNDGDLWIHGMAGAVHITAAEVRSALDDPAHRMAFRLFDDDDGLYGVNTDIRPLPTLVEGSDGRLWFGTYRGVFWVDPRHLVTSPTPPTVIVKDLISGGERFASYPESKLPALTSSVQINFTATNLAIAPRARFQYRLEGTDTQWQEANTRRQAFYTNLGPGHYHFAVRAANEDGLWNAQVASTEFTILPAWYQTTWFRMSCIAAGLVILLMMYRMRFDQVRDQLHGRLQERMLERERIARELHDTLIQGFQGLVLLLSAAIQRVPREHPSQQLMSKALVRADAVLAEARDRVSGLRSSLGLRDDLPGALNDLGHELFHLQPPVFTVTVSGSPRPLHAVVFEETYQIAREALTNAQRHANATHVRLELKFGTFRLHLRVHDDGRGIDSQVLEHNGIPGHWGLRGMRERARKIGAKWHVRSEPGLGTEIDLQIPAAVAFREKSRSSWWRPPFNRSRIDNHEHQEQP